MYKDLFKIFRKRREGKKLSLEEASRATNIHHNILEKIEKGDISSIHMVYLKGFIKIYSQYLGIESQDILKALPQPKDETKTFKEGKPLVDTKERLKIISLTLVRKVLRTRHYKKIIRFVSVLFLSFIVIFSLRAFFSQVHKTLEKKSPALEKKVISRKIAPLKKQRSLEILVKADRDVLMQVKSDGRTVFERIMPKGFSEVFRARKVVYLKVYDGSAIEIEINGKYYGPLSKKRILREIKVTPGSFRFIK